MPEVDAVEKEAEAVMGLGRRGKVSQLEKEACQGQAALTWELGRGVIYSDIFKNSFKIRSD